MSDKTSIEWSDATWNPVTGCTEVSPGCDHCYAKTFAERWRGTPGHHFKNGFDVQLRPDKLDLPLRWRRPRRIFVNSMSDLFHDQVPDDYIARIFQVMAETPHHTYQILTKRHGRMRSLMRAWFGGPGAWADGPLSNVWLGVSAENQQWADIRIPALLDTPAAVRFVSAEPLLGPVELLGDTKNPGPVVVRTGWHQPGGPWGPDEYGYDDQIGIDWVIVGGESGPGARPMHPDWARSLRDQCREASVAFLFKQHGEWVPESMLLHGNNAPAAFLSVDGRTRPLVIGKPTDYPMSRGQDITIRRVGKKTAGRELDGRTWDQYPQAVTHV